MAAIAFTFLPGDAEFVNNINYIRQLALRDGFKLLMVVIDGRAYDADSTHITGGTFRWTDERGEHRVDLSRIDSVQLTLER